MIRRVEFVGLLSGVEGWSPPGGMKDLLSGLFEYQGFDYCVRSMGRFGVWNVVKCASDGRALAEYRVQRDRKTMACDCQAGRKHLACRHKEMVEMFETDRDEGTCGVARVEPHQPDRQRPRVYGWHDASGALTQEQAASAMESLARANRLLERANAGR